MKVHIKISLYEVNAGVNVFDFRHKSLRLIASRTIVTDRKRFIRVRLRYGPGIRWSTRRYPRECIRMKKFLIPALALTAGLAACSNNAQDQTAQAANAIAADASATTENAVDDVSAASDRALGSAERSLDNAGAKLDNATDNLDVKADRAGDRIEAGADRAGASIANGADRAADATGNALTRAGNAIKD
jgi:hypothetical protein